MIKSGISQIGGKFRLRKQLLQLTPHHEFFLSMFLGAGHFELNKPRCRYECFNDLDAEIINYFLIIHQYPEEFNKLKEGVFGLVSQEIADRIANGTLQPRNDIERAYFFYYLNKVTFGSNIWQVRENPPYKGIDPGGVQYKSKYRGMTLPTVCKDKSIIDAKSRYKGINPKTTRPYSNNDCGLLTPIDPDAIKRLRYVNLTKYDFRKAYKMFYEAFYKRKGLEKECLIFEDPPYPGTEKLYHMDFGMEEHNALIELNLESPFNVMQTIGGNCEFYLDSYKEVGWKIKEVFTKYSTDANSQNPTKEYICMNFNIKNFPKMIMDYQPDLMNYIEG